MPRVKQTKYGVAATDLDDIENTRDLDDDTKKEARGDSTEESDLACQCGRFFTCACTSDRPA